MIDTLPTTVVVRTARPRSDTLKVPAHSHRAGNSARISDEDAALMQALADEESRPQWKTAIILRRRQAVISREQGPEVWRDLRDQYADERSITPATLRELINTHTRAGRYRRYPRFANLSYSHFKFAARGVNPLSLLERVVTSADDYGGQPAPVRVLREWLKADGQTEPVDVDNLLLTRLRSLLVSVRARSVSTFKRWVLDSMINEVDRWLNETGAKS